MVIKLISIIKKREKGAIRPDFSISIIIAAYNEEKVIRTRIENIANLKFDFRRLEVIVGSDGSTDNTNTILQQLSDQYPWLKVLLFPHQRGKAAVLNDLFEKAQNEILVFTDANTIFEEDTIEQLAASFNREDIGGVCGRLNIKDKKYKTSGSADEVSYWRYEIFIKQAEGDCNVLIGANGGNYAIRKFLYTPLPLNTPVTDDFFISMMVLSKKYKFVYNNSAAAYEEVSPKLSDEFRRKVRFSATNYQTLVLLKNLLWSKNLLLTFCFWSHKVIRWVMPFIILLIFIVNLTIIQNYPAEFYLISLYIQIGFLSLAFIGFILAILNKRIPVISLFYFFILTNVSMILGLIKFLKRKHTPYWQSTPR